MATSENDILLGIFQGNEGVFEELFKRQYGRLCGYAIKYVKDLDQAEEIVQDLFFNIWNKRESLQITSSLEAYLFRSVRNSCLNYLKHMKIRQLHASGMTQANPASITESDPPVEILELHNRIEEAIASLPPERQKIFRLSRHEGMKYREIAEHLGISIKTVEVQMGKALKYMREVLSDYLIVQLLVMAELILLFI